jgi:hypothetical protein
MNPHQLTEIICAVHLAPLVEGNLDQRGGLMLVAPPGALKSTLVEMTNHYPDALLLTDLNVQTLIDLRDSLTGDNIRTLVFSEFAKLYERNPQTSSNIEGSLRALASEGFYGASFQDQRINRRKAQATLIAAMPPGLVEKQFKHWEETGFNRRFLWSNYGIKGAHILDDAAVELKKLDFGIRDVLRPPPLSMSVPYLLTETEKVRVKMFVKHQPGSSHTQQIQLLSRIWSVLKWWHRENDTVKEADNTMVAFAQSLTRGGSDLVISAPKGVALNGKKR